MLRCTAVVLLPLFLSGCDDGGSDEPVPPPPDVALTPANALVVAGSVLDAVLGLAEAGANVSAVLVAAAEAAAADTGGVASLAIVGTVPGAGGGTAEYLWDDRDADEQMSTGDVFEALFDDFLDATGTRSAGWIGVDGMQVIGDPGVHATWSLAGRLALGAFAVTRNGATTTLAGPVEYGIERRLTVDYRRMAVVEPVASDATTLLPGSLVEYGEYDAEERFLVYATGAIEGAGLGGTLAFVTTQGLTGTFLDTVPTAGVVEVRGADASVLTITVVDATDVRLDLDQDGDGEIDATQTVPWTEL